MVEVLNSSPEPMDYKPAKGESGKWVGKRWFKIYTLRVDPSITTARAAVAWTFGLSADDYAPLVQS
jgi:hypothetical protein